MDEIQENNELSQEMLKDLLVRSEQEIANLRKELKQLREGQIAYRDIIAVHVYPVLIDIHKDYDKACIDAYAAADALLKQRDLGILTEMKPVSDIDMGNIYKLVKMHANDMDLGEKIREYIKQDKK